MPETDRHLAERRLDIWRQAYALMDHRSDFSGPFYDSGYRDVVIEPTLDNDAEPDLITASDSYYAILEVSCSSNKDFKSVRNYAGGGLTSVLRTRFGDRPRVPSGSPFFVTNTSGFTAFPPEMNAIRVSDPVEAHLPSVDDATLRTRLETWSGFPLPPPTYGLKALPESDLREVMFPLAGVLRQVAAEGGSITAAELARLLLGELSTSVSQAGRGRLVRTVSTLLERAAFHLKDYVRWESATDTLTVAKVDSPQARKSFSKALSAWLGTRFLESFSVDSEEDPEEADDET